MCFVALKITHTSFSPFLQMCMIMKDEDQSLCDFIKLPNCRNNNQLIRWKLGSQINLKENDIVVYWSIFAICGTFLTQDSSTELLLTKDPTIIITEWCKSLQKVLLFPKQTGRSNTYKDILLFLKQSSFLSNCETCGKDSIPRWFVWSLGVTSGCHQKSKSHRRWI